MIAILAVAAPPPLRCTSRGAVAAQASQEIVHHAVRDLVGQQRPVRPIPLRYPVDGAKDRKTRELDVGTLELAGPQAVLDQAANATFKLIPFADVLLALIRPEALQISL